MERSRLPAWAWVLGSPQSRWASRWLRRGQTRAGRVMGLPEGGFGGCLPRGSSLSAGLVIQALLEPGAQGWVGTGSLRRGRRLGRMHTQL